MIERSTGSTRRHSANLETLKLRVVVAALRLHEAIHAKFHHRRAKRIHNLVARYIGKKAFFVHIGSADGYRGDYLYELILSNQNWAGIFVEPMPHLFDRLKRNYRSNRSFSFIQAAIGKYNGEGTLYYIDARSRNSLRLPLWAEQINSLDQSHLEKHFGSAIAPYVSSMVVPVMTLAQVLSTENVSEIDLFYIDAEGRDADIITQIDFEQTHPKMIIYEHSHLRRDLKQDIELLLKRKRYDLRYDGSNTICISSI